MTIISKDMFKAVNILNQKGLVAIPTETVYGLTGNIYSKKAINGIFEMKQRPFSNPLIVPIKSLERAAMHRLDKLNLDMIVAERFPESGLGKAINDRLERASYIKYLTLNKNVE